jgi:hypothetical protein
MTAHRHLDTYLNDHLAGSTAGLEILDRFRTSGGSEDWASALRDAIVADRHELEKLMQAACVARSALRQTAGWMTEKLAEFKTRLDDPAAGPLQRLELLEALALGIDGKRALWTALQTIAGDVPGLERTDYVRLIARAVEQRHAVELRRLDAASEALASPARGNTP